MYLCILGCIRTFLPLLEHKFNLPPDVLLQSNAYSEVMNDIRILIVDDVERVRKNLSTFLSLTGHVEVVGEAANGAEAIHLVRDLRPHVVLMDLEMPVMDGFEATRQIKILQPACRVIALTIHADELEQQRAFQAGADDFIVKGAPLSTLMDSIHKMPTSGQMPKGEQS